MLKQKTLLLTSIIAMVMLITVIFGGCGQKPEDVPVDSSITSEVQESEVDEPAATAEPEKIPEQTQETSQPKAAEVALTAETYLSQLSQGDSFEFNFSDYNSEYKVGNKITLAIEMESTAMFNGCVGVSVGSNYEWQQEEFEFQAGQGTVTWTVTPSVDNAQLNLWFADGAPVGIISIDVTVEEVEPAVIGKLATYTEQDTFEFTFSEYNPQYQVGDLVKISVVLESDGDFNGCIGASVGKDHTWNQKEYQYNEGGRYTLTWTVKPSSDYSNIGIWWVGGTSVGIHSITVTILEEEIGIHGDYITMFTDKGNFEFAPSVINPSFKFGDKIRITVTLESDGEFTGSLGTAVGGNYEWTQTEYESDTGISTWVLDISPVIDSVQLGVWYIGGTAVGVLDIDIEIQKWGYQHEEVRGLLYTSTSKNDSYPFMPSDYCEFEDGDVITIRVELYSNDIYNGCVGVNDVNGTYRSANYNSNGGAVVCELVVAASTKEEAKIEFWWMNGKVALNSITVTKGGTIVDTNDDDTFHSGEVTKYRTASDYCKYSPGDTVTVTVELSGDGYFKGSVGMPGLEWTQSDFESSTGSKVSCTLVVPGAVSKLHDIKISIWWSEGTYVKIDNISVTAEKSGGDDDQPDEDEQMDTSSWQLAFNGFSRDWSGWNSVNGDAGKLEFSATIQDIMDINQITDISDFGGFLFQIWHVNSKYNGRTYSYKLDINGSTHREGSGTIQCSEYNSTDVVQISADDYAFSPSDTISGVITVTDKEEPGEPDDPATVITIFEGGKADESYESDDVSWLLDAEDNAVITLVYTCDDPSHAGWGVLGWGAEVDGNWIDAPSGYEADGSNATKEVTVKTTAAKLRAALGIQAGSTVTHIKLGAWSGGRIISLGISASGGTQEPDDAIYTFTYKEWQAIQDKNAAEGTNNSYTYSFSPIQYGQFADGDTVNVSVTFETDGSYFNGALGANDASGSWQDSGQIESTSNPWTWTIPNAGTNEKVQIQLWYMNQDNTYVKVKEIKVEKDGGTQPPDTDIFTFTYDQWKAIQDENTANGTNNSYGFSFSPSQYGQFADGDTVNVSVTFETDGSYFNGALGANDASGSWQDSGQIESTSNPWTWTIPNAGTNEKVQIQLWYMNQDNTYVKVKEIKVEKDGGTQPPDTDIFTFTYDQWKAIQDENTANGTNNSYGFSFSPIQYGQFADGDTVNVSVTFETDGSYFNGALGANDASGSWQDSGQIESTSNPWTWTIPNAGTNENINIQLWYMNQDVTYVKVKEIKVEKDGGTQPPDTDIFTFTYDQWKAIQDENTANGTNNSYGFSFSPSQYGQFADGDTVNVSVTFETDGSYFNGALGANDASGSWQDSGQIESTSNPWTWTLPNAGTNENINIQLWYMNQDVTYVKVTDIKVEGTTTTGLYKSNNLMATGEESKHIPPADLPENEDSVNNVPTVSGNNAPEPEYKEDDIFSVSGNSAP